VIRLMQDATRISKIVYLLYFLQKRPCDTQGLRELEYLRLNILFYSLYSPSSIAEVSSEWSYTSISAYAFGMAY
jgi:hypothetical protein